MGFHKDMLDELIDHFNNLNKIGKGSYFDQSWRPISAGHSQIERRIIYALSSYTVIALVIIKIGTVQLAHILLLS